MELQWLEMEKGDLMTEASERVRKAEAKRKAAGMREIRVWVPDDPAAIATVKGLAKALCEGAKNEN